MREKRQAELLAPAGAAQTVEELEKQEVLQGLMR